MRKGWFGDSVLVFKLCKVKKSCKYIGKVSINEKGEFSWKNGNKYHNTEKSNHSNHLYFVPLFLLKPVFLKGNLLNAPPQKSRKWYAVPNIRTKPEILPGMNLKTKQILYLGKLKFLFFQWKSVCREMAKLGGITWHL